MERKANKNINIHFKFLLLVLVMFSTILVYSNVYATKIKDYKIDAKIMNNGNMHVEEYLKYYFDEDVNGVYRDILYKYAFGSQKDTMKATSSRYQASDVSNIKVYTSDTSFNDLIESYEMLEEMAMKGNSGVYTLTEKIDNGYRKYLKVYMPAKSMSYKYVKYEYDIEDVAVKYNDAGEIYWNFVGGDWKNEIENLNINITFENSSITPENIQVFPHSYVRDVSYTIDNDKIQVNATDISTKTAVDARIVFPVDSLEFATKTRNEDYDYDALLSIEKTMENDKTRYLVSETISKVLFVVGILGLIAIIKETNKIVNKGKKKEKDIEIYTDTLDKYSLGKYATILNRFGGYSSNNTLLATILDLSDRKYIIMEPQKKLKKERFSNIEYNYNMKLNSDKDYSELNEYEIMVINYLFNGRVGNITNITNFKLQSIELNERLKELSKSTVRVMEYNKTCQKLTEEQSEEMYDKVPRKPKLYSCLFMFLLGVIYIANLFIVSPAANVSEISLMLGVILLFILIFSLPFILSARSLKEEYAEEYNKLMGLKKYLKEYSKLKDRYPIELVLWNKYLTFAALFGIADKVSKEFKEELLAQGYDDDYIFMTYPVLNMSINSQNIAQSFATSTGSSSSGGYSGGGSGGGGGRRWRWRHLLKPNNYVKYKIMGKLPVILYINLKKSKYIKGGF